MVLLDIWRCFIDADAPYSFTLLNAAVLVYIIKDFPFIRFHNVLFFVV